MTVSKRSLSYERRQALLTRLQKRPENIPEIYFHIND